MIDKSKYYRVVNGIEDWVAYGIIDPERVIPESMHRFYQVYDQEDEPMFDLSTLKVTDVCWSCKIGDKTVIRLGSLKSNGTLISEFEFDNWLYCISEGEEDLLMDFEEYKKMVQENQSEII